MYSGWRPALATGAADRRFHTMTGLRFVPLLASRSGGYVFRMDARPRNVTLLALTMGVFLVTLNVTVVTVALPDIQRSLHARPDELEWVIDAYNLVGASLLLSAGFFADRFGRKRVLCTGYSVFAGGALLCAVAPTAGWLIAFRVLQAVGGTALTPTSLSIVANLYRDPLERARAIGIWGVSSGVGLGAGPIVGGAVTRLDGLAVGVRRERRRRRSSRS